MFALQVEYLTEQAVAQEYNDRTLAEWPPHPARLFFALASAHFESDQDPNERRFLEWLEALDPPALYATSEERREVTVHYVPVNDTRLSGRRARHGSKPPSVAELALLPEYRPHQPRTFPVAIPEDPVVYFVWPEVTISDSLLPAATRLCRKVSYLGHSSSLVAVRPATSSPPPTWLPVAGGQADAILRVCFQGHLSALEHLYKRRQVSGVRTALPAVMQGYRRAEALPSQQRSTSQSVFDGMVVFRRTAGPPLPSVALPLAVSALRGAALSLSPQPVPEVLSGHAPDGSPTDRPHVAFVALPDVGHRHADGHLVGLGVVLPRGLSREDRIGVYQALASIEHLTMGSTGAWSVARVGAAAVQRGLAERTWRGPARRWASATPVLLDRFPKRLFGPETESMLAEACSRVGLPHPRYVLAAPHSILQGAEPTFSFLRSRGRDERRPLVHVVLEFAEEVEGPVLLGAGRYRGWGLFKPVA